MEPTQEGNTPHDRQNLEMSQPLQEKHPAQDEQLRDAITSSEKQSIQEHISQLQQENHRAYEDYEILAQISALAEERIQTPEHIEALQGDDVESLQREAVEAERLLRQPQVEPPSSLARSLLSLVLRYFLHLVYIYTLVMAMVVFAGAVGTVFPPLSFVRSLPPIFTILLVAVYVWSWRVRVCVILVFGVAVVVLLLEGMAGQVCGVFRG